MVSATVVFAINYVNKNVNSMPLRLMTKAGLYEQIDHITETYYHSVTLVLELIKLKEGVLQIALNITTHTGLSWNEILNA